MRLPDSFTIRSTRIETATMIVLLLIGAAAWAFLALASEMLEGELKGFDETIILALRVPGDPADPIGGPKIEVMMRDLTALGGFTVLTLITISVVVYLFLRRQRFSALFMAAAIIGGSLLSSIAKFGFSRPRPDLVSHGVEVTTSSFPSGHSMMSAVTYLTLAVMLARAEPDLRLKTYYFAVAIVVTTLVGFSRVYLGVHWPSDVLAGWTLGAAWALGVALVARFLEQRGRIEPSRGEGAM